MFAVNLGTRGGDAARNLVEYCNHPGGTYYPTCAVSMDTNVRTASSFGASATRWMARGKWSIKLQRSMALSPGSRENDALDRSCDRAHGLRILGQNMPSYGRWEDEVLEHTFEHVDYISLHTYLNNADDTRPSWRRLT